MSEQLAASSEQQQDRDMMGARRSVLMRFTFVRHGETQANKDRCIQGTSDVPLCQSGEEQATRAGERLGDVRFTRVYASDLCRASKTCRLILTQNTRHPPPIVIDTRLRERNFGTVEGLGFEEVLKMAEAEGSAWPQYSPPGSESLGDVQGRLVAFFKEVCQSIYDKNNNNTKKSKNKQEEEETEETDPDMEEENMKNEAKEKQERKKKNEEEQEAADADDDGDSSEHVLIVSHGAALRQLYIHFHRTLGCALPQNLGPETAAKLTPNTGITQYTVRYSPKTYTMHCLCIHDNKHVHGM